MIHTQLSVTKKHYLVVLTFIASELLENLDMMYSDVFKIDLNSQLQTGVLPIKKRTVFYLLMAKKDYAVENFNWFYLSRPVFFSSRFR